MQIMNNISIQDIEKESLSKQNTAIDKQNFSSTHSLQSSKYEQQFESSPPKRYTKLSIIFFVSLFCITILAVTYAVYLISHEDFFQQYDEYAADFQKQVPHHRSSFVAQPISELPSDFKAPTPMEQIKRKEYVCLQMGPLLSAVQKQVEAYSTENKFICSSAEERFEDFSDKTFHMMSAYNVFLQTCKDTKKRFVVDRENLVSWNRDRARIEWAIRNVRQGDRVLLNHRSKFNLLQIIIIAKLIGPTGVLDVVGPYEQSQCFQTNVDAHGLQNIQVLNFDQNYFQASKNYSILIEHEDIIDSLQQIFTIKPSIKIFVHVRTQKLLQNLPRQLRFQRYLVDPYSCKDPAIQKMRSGEVGFYSITLKENTAALVNSIQDKPKESEFFQPYFEKYKENKAEKLLAVKERYQKLQQIKDERSCIDRNLLDRNENFTVSVYGNYLYGVSEDQTKAWEQEREAVEWVRGKLSSSSVVYYELRDFNILAIAEIGRILSKGKLIVFCKSNECNWIERQKRFEQISSIETIETSSFETATSSDAIITDNQSMIDKSIAAGYLQKGKLLGYFTRERESSFKVFGKLVPMHNLSQIKLPSELGECRGFGYQNYFWDIDELNQFYDISLSGYQIFIYWRGSPKNLTVSRRNSLQEVIQLSKVEVKIFNKQLFYLTQGFTPIHEGFKYLSATHESDYFRVYMIHNFGGAYADIKHYHYDWRPYFKKLYDDPQKYAMGYAQQKQEDIGCNEQHSPPPCSEITAKYKQLIGNGVYIYKRNTILTQDAMSRIHKTLDSKLQLLKLHPSTRLRQSKGWISDGKSWVYSEYPMRWGQMSGEHMSRVAYANLDRYYYDLPFINMIDYQ